MKITGKEFKEFLEDKTIWKSDDMYYDDAIIEVNGNPDGDIDPTVLKDDDVVDVKYGVLCDSRGPIQDFPHVVKAWKKKRTRSRLLIECDKDKRDTLVELIKENGGIVIV